MKQLTFNFPVYWTTNHGEKMLVDHITPFHLKNILLMLVRTQQELITMAVYADYERNKEQLKSLLLHGAFTQDTMKVHMMEFAKKMNEDYQDMNYGDEFGYDGPYFGHEEILEN